MSHTDLIEQHFLDAAVEYAQNNVGDERLYDWDAYRESLTEGENDFWSNIHEMSDWLDEQLNWFGIEPDRRAHFIDWAQLWYDSYGDDYDRMHIVLLNKDKTGFTTTNWGWEDHHDDRDFATVWGQADNSRIWYADLDNIYGQFPPIKKAEQPAKLTLVAKGDECETKGNPDGVMVKA